MKAERIKEDADYECAGHVYGVLGKGTIAIQIDIGFGDEIKPGPVETDYAIGTFQFKSRVLGKNFVSSSIGL